MRYSNDYDEDEGPVGCMSFVLGAVAGGLLVGTIAYVLWANGWLCP